MDLAAVVKRYVELSGGFDQPLHLSRFGLAKPEIEKLFAAWDEDYQISRFMLLTRARDEELTLYPEDQKVFRINDYDYSHVTFRSGIEQHLTPA